MSAARKLTFVEPADVETQRLPWGYLNWLSEPRVTGAEQFSTGIATVTPGHGHARHNHPGTEEILYVIKGTGRQMVEVDGEPVTREVGPGTLIHIAAGAYHSTLNTGGEEMIVLAVYAPPGPEAFLRTLPECTVEPPQREPVGP